MLSPLHLIVWGYCLGLSGAKHPQIESFLYSEGYPRMLSPLHPPLHLIIGVGHCLENIKYLAKQPHFAINYRFAGINLPSALGNDNPLQILEAIHQIRNTYSQLISDFI